MQGRFLKRCFTLVGLLACAGLWACDDDDDNDLGDAAELDAGGSGGSGGRDAGRTDGGQGDAGRTDGGGGSGGSDSEVDGGDSEVDGGDSEIDGGDSEVDGGDSEIDGGDSEVDGGDSEVDGGDSEIDGGDSEVDGGDGAVIDCVDEDDCEEGLGPCQIATCDGECHYSSRCTGSEVCDEENEQCVPLADACTLLTAENIRIGQSVSLTANRTNPFAVSAEVGVRAVEGDPEEACALTSDWQWSEAEWLSPNCLDCPDILTAQFTPDAAGDYLWTIRATADNGAHWVYCDLEEGEPRLGGLEELDSLCGHTGRFTVTDLCDNACPKGTRVCNNNGLDVTEDSVCDQEGQCSTPSRHHEICSPSEHCVETAGVGACEPCNCSGASSCKDANTEIAYSGACTAAGECTTVEIDCQTPAAHCNEALTAVEMKKGGCSDDHCVYDTVTETKPCVAGSTCTDGVVTTLTGACAEGACVQTTQTCEAKTECSPDLLSVRSWSGSCDGDHCGYSDAPCGATASPTCANGVLTTYAKACDPSDHFACKDSTQTTNCLENHQVCLEGSDGVMACVDPVIQCKLLTKNLEGVSIISEDTKVEGTVRIPGLTDLPESAVPDSFIVEMGFGQGELNPDWIWEQAEVKTRAIVDGGDESLQTYTATLPLTDLDPNEVVGGAAYNILMHVSVDGGVSWKECYAGENQETGSITIENPCLPEEGNPACVPDVTVCSESVNGSGLHDQILTNTGNCSVEVKDGRPQAICEHSEETYTCDGSGKAFCVSESAYAYEVASCDGGECQKGEPIPCVNGFVGCTEDGKEIQGNGSCSEGQCETKEITCGAIDLADSCNEEGQRVVHSNACVEESKGCDIVKTAVDCDPGLVCSAGHCVDPKVTWCRLQGSNLDAAGTPARGSVSLNETEWKIQGRVNVPGLTDRETPVSADWLKVQLVVGITTVGASSGGSSALLPTTEDLSADTTVIGENAWAFDAVLNPEATLAGEPDYAAGSDEYVATINMIDLKNQMVSPALATYLDRLTTAQLAPYQLILAYRVSADGGNNWQYCDRDATSDNPQGDDGWSLDGSSAFSSAQQGQYALTPICKCTKDADPKCEDGAITYNDGSCQTVEGNPTCGRTEPESCPATQRTFCDGDFRLMQVVPACSDEKTCAPEGKNELLMNCSESRKTCNGNEVMVAMGPCETIDLDHAECATTFSGTEGTCPDSGAGCKEIDGHMVIQTNEFACENGACIDPVYELCPDAGTFLGCDGKDRRLAVKGCSGLECMVDTVPCVGEMICAPDERHYNQFDAECDADSPNHCRQLATSTTGECGRSFQCIKDHCAAIPSFGDGLYEIPAVSEAEFRFKISNFDGDGQLLVLDSEGHEKFTISSQNLKCGDGACTASLIQSKTPQSGHFTLKAINAEGGHAEHEFEIYPVPESMQLLNVPRTNAPLSEAMTSDQNLKFGINVKLSTGSQLEDLVAEFCIDDEPCFEGSCEWGSVNIDCTLSQSFLPAGEHRYYWRVSVDADELGAGHFGSVGSKPWSAPAHWIDEGFAAGEYNAEGTLNPQKLSVKIDTADACVVGAAYEGNAGYRSPKKGSDFEAVISDPRLNVSLVGVTAQYALLGAENALTAESWKPMSLAFAETGTKASAFETGLKEGEYKLLTRVSIDNEQNWVYCTHAGTGGESAPEPASSENLDDASKLVVKPRIYFTEISTDPRLFEIYNSTGESVDLSACSLAFRGANVTLTGTLEDGAAQVFAPEGTNSALVTPVVLDAWVMTSSEGLLTLTCNGQVQDVVGKKTSDEHPLNWGSSRLWSGILRKCSSDTGNSKGFDEALEDSNIDKLTDYSDFGIHPGDGHWSFGTHNSTDKCYSE